MAKSEMNIHRLIKLRKSDSYKLWWVNRGLCFPVSLWPRKHAFVKLYKEGAKNIEKMLDLSKIIKNNRTFKILLKNSLMNTKIAKQLKHTEKHLIDLEDAITDSDELNQIFEPGA